ncbi:MAG: GumC family protein [Bacteroidales bacterium]
MIKIKNNNSNESSTNILDLLRFLLSHWKWYILSLVLFISYFTYDYNKTPFTYRRTATVMIRTSENSPATVRLQRNVSMSKNEGASEILQLRTKDLMRSAISRIRGDLSYSIMDGLRQKELYSLTPVRVDFPELKPNDHFSFQVILENTGEATLVSSVFGAGEMRINLGDTISSPFGKLVVNLTDQTDFQKKTITVTKYDLESMTGYFLSNFNIIQPRGSVPVLQLSMNDLSGQRASDLLNALIDIFNEKSIEDKSRVALHTSNFINDRLEIIERELYAVESSLEEIKLKNAGIDVNVTASINLSDSRDNQIKRKEIEMKLLLLSSLRKYLEASSQVIEIIPHNSGMDNAEIEQMIAKFNNSVLYRKSLAESKSTNNPAIIELDNSLIESKNTIRLAVANLADNLELQKKITQGNELTAKNSIYSIPTKQREELTVERQRKVKEDLYIFLLNKREENSLNGALNDSNIRIIDSPTGSINPLSPIKTKKLLMGSGCGLLFPSIILLLLYKFDTRVHTRKDVEENTSVPFLGSIPFHKQNKADSPILVRSDSRDSISESFRILRTNIGFIGSGNKVITCISFTPGSGKTFVSLNLAACLSMSNKKVVLIDLDLRKATLSSIVDMKGEIGMSHYLSNVAISADAIIHLNPLDCGFDLIASGAIAPNPAELLMSNRLDQLIGELKEKYDFILIDNVPVGLVADSTIISRVTDISLFVLRAGQIDKRQLAELDVLYEDKKIKNMTLLLNGVTQNSKSGYGYGYGYGYGE